MRVPKKLRTFRKYVSKYSKTFLDIADEEGTFWLSRQREFLMTIMMITMTTITMEMVTEDSCHSKEEEVSEVILMMRVMMMKEVDA